MGGMKRLLPVIPAVACLALSGCGGSAAPAPAPVPVAPAATAPPPAAVPTPVPVAAAPSMPSAPKPEAKTRPQSREESSSAPSNSGQTPSRIVESIISQIQSTSDEEQLRRLESELTMLKYEYSGANNGLMSGAMNSLAAACETKRLGLLHFDFHIRNARENADLAERLMKNANTPPPSTEDWQRRFEAERARKGGRRY